MKASRDMERTAANSTWKSRTASCIQFVRVLQVDFEIDLLTNHSNDEEGAGGDFLCLLLRSKWRPEFGCETFEAVI